MEERWRRLEDFPEYAISNYGDVCNIRRDRLLRQSLNNRGIPMVGLTPPQGRQVMRSVSLLVIKTFDPEPDLPSHFSSVINLDGIRENCRLDNLMWRPLNFTRAYHEQFEFEWFHRTNVELLNLSTNEEFLGYKQACVTYGIKAVGIIMSHSNDERVFPTSHRYRIL